MQSMQRQFGKLLNRGPGDNAKVSILLNDYEDADRLLARITESARSWRDSWVSMLSSQLEVVTVYESLYDPIVGAYDGHGAPLTPTPELQLHRTFKLKEAYSDLKTELVDEIATIEERIIRPATDARDAIAPIRKTIKKRENKRLDYEKVQDKVAKLHRKPNKSAKDDAALAKLEEELANLSEEFQIADNHLRETLPPLISATFSLVTPLLAAHIMVQNQLLGLYYTILNNYCNDQNFPSPPPPMEEVIAQWSEDFKLVQREAESISFIARGKAVHQPMKLAEDGQGRKPSSSLGAPQSARDGFRRSSSGLIPSTNGGGAGRPMRIPSANSIPAMGPPTSPAASDYSPQPSPRIAPSPGFKNPNYSGLLRPTDFTTATNLGQSPGASPSSARIGGTDYFSSRDRPSTASTVASNVSQSSTPAFNGIGKKKPPPPPPPKRIPSTKPDEFVIAQYSFVGQGAGDLSFNEGDMIKIVKKTNTDQDWWVGELAGVRGNFPANYCRAA